MINEELTFRRFGYYAKDVANLTTKRIVVNCDKCNGEREIYNHGYRALCRKCSSIGKNKGQKWTKEHCKNWANAIRGKKQSKETCLKKSEIRKGTKHSEETKQKMRNSALKGKDSPLWQGGITPLHNKIRNLPEAKQWKQEVYKKDNYTCQKCDKRGGKLDAHHIKEFSAIFKEFLQVHNRFSLIEDKETLIRLATSYQPFWDITNGKTLCIECHDLVEKEKFIK